MALCWWQHFKVWLLDGVGWVQIDITVNNLLAVVNTKLLRDYAAIDGRLAQLVFVVKHWAKRRQVNDAYRGTLSSYCYVLMCIAHLQHRQPPILPCLQAMQPATHVRWVHNFFHNPIGQGKKRHVLVGNGHAWQGDARFCSAIQCLKHVEGKAGCSKFMAWCGG